MNQDQILDSDLTERQKKPFNVLVLAIILIGAGGFIGVTTNLINGNLSEEYFRRIMGWNFQGIWKAAILQGLFEGVVYGIIFSFIFTIGFAKITKRKADWGFIKKQLKKIAFVIYGSWIIGGVVAIILAFIFPEDYDRLIYSVPQETLPRICFAWVGGSIVGGMVGGVISLVWGLFSTNQDWKNELQNEV